MNRTLTRPQAEALRTAAVYGGEEPPSGSATAGRYLVDGRPNTLAVLVRLGMVETVTEVVGIDREEHTQHVLTRAGETIRQELRAGGDLPTLGHVASVVQQDADRAALDGRYEPNAPGATTLHDARPLTILGKPVSVTIEGKGERAYLYVGTTWLYSGPVPQEIRTRADVNPWAARVALGDPAPWAQVGARIRTAMGPGTVTGRNIWADGTYVITYRADRDPADVNGDDWLITAASEHLGRLCALCDTIGDDNDPEYPARFSPFGAYLCGFCSHAYSDRYVARTIPGRPEDGWAVFDRKSIDWTTIRMTHEEAKGRAAELSAKITPAPGPVELQDWERELLAEEFGPERVAVEVARMGAADHSEEDVPKHYRTHRRVAAPVTPRTPRGVAVVKVDHATLAEALDAAKEEATPLKPAYVFCDAVTIGRTEIARVDHRGEVAWFNDYANPARRHLVPDQH
jgi:hypothetical protein